jgi:hypothetical protein
MPSMPSIYLENSNLNKLFNYITQSRIIIKLLDSKISKENAVRNDYIIPYEGTFHTILINKQFFLSSKSYLHKQYFE